MSKTIEIKVRIAEITLYLAEATGNGVSRIQSGLNRVLNKATERLNAYINTRLESLGEALFVQANAENTKPFDKARKVSAQIAKLLKQRAAYLSDEEVNKAIDKYTALLVKRRELLNRKRYF